MLDPRDINAVDVLSLFQFAAFVGLPGLDKRAVFVWFRDTLFGGDENMRRWGVFAVEKCSVIFCCALWYVIMWTDRRTGLNEWRSNQGGRRGDGKGWPWQSKDPKERQAFRDLQLQTLALMAKVWSFFFVVTLFVEPLAFDSDPDTIPPWYVACGQIVGTQLVFETGFYFGHRLMHWKPLYVRFHALHHQYVDNNIAMASYLTHPIDQTISAIIPAAIGPALFGMHACTLYQYIILGTAATTNSHSGYEHPWLNQLLVPFPGARLASSDHDLHHIKRSVNYGSANWCIWDKLLGTYEDPREVKWRAKKVE